MHYEKTLASKSTAISLPSLTVCGSRVRFVSLSTSIILEGQSEWAAGRVFSASTTEQQLMQRSAIHYLASIVRTLKILNNKVVISLRKVFFFYFCGTNNGGILYWKLNHATGLVSVFKHGIQYLWHEFSRVSEVVAFSYVWLINEYVLENIGCYLDKILLGRLPE